jgi:hypothetical protein
MSKLFNAKLYLANHFQSLKAEIDYAIEMKLKENNNNQSLIDNWIQMINLIDSYETECYSNINHNNIELNNEKILFNNKTIMYLKDFNMNNNNETIVGKLIFIKDAYLNKNCKTIDQIIKLKAFNQLILNNTDQIEIIQLLLNVNTIDISWLNIKNIEKNLFYDYSNLERLDLSGNNIEEIDLNLFTNNPHLISIDLSSNKFKILNVTKLFKNNLKLKDLKLFRNQLVNELDFSHLSNLTHLNIKNNNINIINLSASLKVVNLSTNHLSYLNLDEMINLEEINLNNNFFKSISENLFKNAQKLRFLYLSENQIDKLVLNNELNNLQVLLLNNNFIKIINNDLFMNCLKLTKIDLSSNRIKFLPDKIFQKLANLKDLNLNNNQLEFINENLFCDLYVLESIEIAYNKLKEIGKNLFKNNPSLLKINLEHNEITTLNNNLFEEQINLNVLKLSANKLSTDFIETILNDKATLKSFQLFENLK